MSLGTRLAATLAAFGRDREGASAVEFAIVSMPFILMLLAILQLGLYFMAQASLDAGVIKTADSLVNTYYATTTPATLTPASLKTMVVTNSGGIIQNDGSLSVELREFSALTSGAVPIGNVVDANAPQDVLALRAQGTVASVVPGLSTIYIRSTALMRRQKS